LTEPCTPFVPTVTSAVQRMRNTAIGLHRTTGATNIARATRHSNRHSNDLTTAVTSNYPRTQ